MTNTNKDPFFEMLADQIEEKGWPDELDAKSPVGVSIRLTLAARAAKKGGQPSC
jgi:hypothetical protein